MAYIFFSTQFNRLLLCCTLVAFSLTSIPLPCYCEIKTSTDDLAFAYRIEQLLEKVMKASKKNDINKLVDLMLDVKREVESYGKTTIDLDKQIDTIEKEIKKEGAKIPKNEFKEIRKMLKQKEKQAEDKMHYLANYLEHPEISYNIEDDQEFFESTKENKENEEIKVPIRLTVGVTVALVGLFLIVVPVIPPPIKVWGKDMVIYGVGIAAEACYSISEKKKYLETLLKD